MTYEQAMKMLERDRQAIEQSLSQLETVKALYSIGERDKAMDLLAATRHGIKQHFTGKLARS